MIQPVTENDIKSRMMIQNKQKIIPVCGILLCKWSEISLGSGISLFPSLVTINPCCAFVHYRFFICIIFYIQHGKSQICRDPYSVSWGLHSSIFSSYSHWNIVIIHSHLWIERVLACKVLNRNTVFTSILLRFAFVSLGFYCIFTNMLRIYLFFLVWQQKYCCSLKSHSLSLDFHNYKHVLKNYLLVCFLPREDKPWETSMIYSKIYTWHVVSHQN